MTRRKKKAPAFQFYPSDWLASETVSAMSSAQEGAYIRLLCYAWLSGKARLPDDREKLMRLSRLSEAEWDAFDPLFRRAFTKRSMRDPFLYQVRLQIEQKKQREYRVAQQKRGLKSAESRRCAVNGGSHPVAQNVNQTGTLCLLSPPSGVSPKGETIPPTPLTPGSDSSTEAEPKPKRTRKQHTYAPDFERFWLAYPESARACKPEAAVEFAKAVRLLEGRFGEQAAEWLIETARQFAESPKGVSGEYVPHPHRWLKACRYDDDRKSWQRVSGSSGGRQQRTFSNLEQALAGMGGEP